MKVSLTTTLPYVNADPHVGFALEIVQADVVARYRRFKGDDVFFNTGTDEHGVKIYRKALEVGKDPQAYVDEYATRFKLLKETLNLSYDAFIRTTDPHHKKAAQEFWKRCEASGDIYKRAYKVKYCVGCELEKMESELEDGKCPIHPSLKLEHIDEENYYFRFSKYQAPLLSFYNDHPDFVVPDYRFNEIKAFVERGLEDFSISRLKEKMPWGVPVPGDPDHVMYVWFDALVNYISTLGWPDEKYAEWWPSIQFAGKDNLRQQSAMWQAMLMSAGLEPSKQIVIHGFVTSGGQKMSKSLGNVINPVEVVNIYGADALRYFLLRHIHPFEDSDFTMERFHEAYTANLVNGLGNLVSRVMKLAETHLEAPVTPKPFDWNHVTVLPLESYQCNGALDYIWEQIGKLDARMNDEAPFKLIKTELERAKQIIRELAEGVYEIGNLLAPHLPATGKKIVDTVLANKKPESMFPRIETK